MKNNKNKGIDIKFTFAFMRVVIQRVSKASVCVDEKICSEIKNGLLIFVGIEDADNQQDVDWLCQKILDLRIFADSGEKMNCSVKNIDGEILVVSQFTLHASTQKGNRPSYLKAAKPETAIPLYENFVNTLTNLYQKPIKTGVFGADMQVALLNDGPVTIIMDTKNKE